MKKAYVLLILLVALPSSIMQAKSKKNSIIKSNKDTIIKDKTCLNIRELFDEMSDLLLKSENKHIDTFLKNNQSFFENHNKKIKRFVQTMDTFFFSGEKRRAQKELLLIQAFYLCNAISNIDDEDQIAEFVRSNYDKSVWYVNSIAHVQRLHFNFTGFADQLKAIIKFLKNDKIIKTISMDKELLYSLINKLESILYTVTEQGEHKIEKRKQRLHLAAEFTKGFLRNLSR